MASSFRQYFPFRRRTTDITTTSTTGASINGTHAGGTHKKPRKRKPVWREWLDAGLFAIVAATIIRMFLVEAYTIPTGSMEGSMLVNDFLFVSKLSYGPRMPITPLALPLIHNSVAGGKSYSDAVQWDYKRLRTGSVKRYDVVVFNFPNGDTVMKDRPADDYYQEVLQQGHEAVRASHEIITHPIDKKENYIKRCVGIPGDKIEVRNGVLYLNGQLAPDFAHLKTTYRITMTQGGGLSEDFLEENGVNTGQDGSGDLRGNDGTSNYILLQKNQLPAFKAIPGTVVEPLVYPMGTAEVGTFPQDTTNYKWNRDNYGPIVLPKRGATVQLTPQNIALYRRVIRNYEGNTLDETGGQFRINGKPATIYTFKQDYYWMMGDNRHNSLDSRYWGFVPEDHVVGKAWFVWLSYGEGGLRWSRLFRSIKTLEK